MRDVTSPSLSMDTVTRKALFAALKDPDTREVFLASLVKMRDSALEVLRTADQDGKDSSDTMSQDDARKRYLSAESMLLAYAEGRTPKEQTANLIQFIQDALDNSLDKRSHRTYSRRSLLEKCFTENAKEGPEAAKVALDHLSKDLQGKANINAPETPSVSRRDLIEKAGLGAVGGFAVGGIASHIVDEVVRAPNVPALSRFAPSTIDMAIGSLTGAIYKYWTSHGIIIEEKKFTAELDRIFTGTASLCEEHVATLSNEHGFFHALKTDTAFRVEFLGGLKKKRDEIQQKILDQNVPTDYEVREFLACDSILNAYNRGRRNRKMFNTVIDPVTKIEKFEPISLPPETLGAEENNQGNIYWLITYLRHTLDPAAQLDNPDTRSLWKQSFKGPDFAHPGIWKVDMQNHARASLDRLYTLTNSYEAPPVGDKPKPEPTQPKLKPRRSHPSNEAAREVIDRVVPKPDMTRRDFIQHTKKGALKGAAAGAVIAAGVHSIPDVHEKTEAWGISTSEALMSGAFIGALVGGLYHHRDKDNVTQRKKTEAEIEYVLSCAAAFCLEEAKKPVRSAAR